MSTTAPGGRCSATTAPSTWNGGASRRTAYLLTFGPCGSRGESEPSSDSAYFALLRKRFNSVQSASERMGSALLICWIRRLEACHIHLISSLLRLRHLSNRRQLGCPRPTKCATRSRWVCG